MSTEQSPSGDPTAEAIASVAETMQGTTVGAGDTGSAAEVEVPLPPMRGRLETPSRPRYSDSDSAGRYSLHFSKRYRHDIWAHDKRPDGTEEPGHLSVTAYLDSEGYIDDNGNGYDRYHYRTAADLANLAHMGFKPIMEELGILVSVHNSDLYYNRYCNIKVDFPSSALFIERANAILARHAEATGKEPIKFVNSGKGRYSSELYLDSVGRQEYLIAEEYGTPTQTVDGIDEGTHDVLTHGLAIILASGTDLPSQMQADASKNKTWVDDARDERAARATLGSYMRNADAGFSLPTFMGALKGEEESLRHFRAIAGMWPGKILEQIRKNATTPHETGLLVPQNND